MIARHHQRVQAALKRLTILNSEQQVIYRMALHRVEGLTTAEQIRLDQIAYEIAVAQDEFNQEKYRMDRREYQ